MSNGRKEVVESLKNIVINVSKTTGDILDKLEEIHDKDAGEYFETELDYTFESGSWGWFDICKHKDGTTRITISTSNDYNGGVESEEIILMTGNWEERVTSWLLDFHYNL